MPSKVQGQCQATLDVPWPKLDRAPSVRCRGSGSVHIGTARTTNAIRLPLQLPTKLQRCHTLSGSSSGLLLVARNSSGTAKSSLRNDWKPWLNSWNSWNSWNGWNSCSYNKINGRPLLEFWTSMESYRDKLWNRMNSTVKPHRYQRLHKDIAPQRSQAQDTVVVAWPTVTTS